ncbi:MAG: MOSC domain-containing protein [Betaproteobacteria bacterium]
MSIPATDLQAVIAQLLIYPVKSCGPVALGQALLTDQGLDLDRSWMVVDERGQFISQREQPRLALVQPALRSSDLVLRAPGMLALHLGLESVESPAQVEIWDEPLQAWDMGAVAAQWFSDFLGRPARLVRFDPQVERVCDRRWTGGQTVLNTFSDGFPLMLLSQPSLQALNARLQASGRAPVDMLRFRPNIVLAPQDPQTWPAHQEDHITEFQMDTPQGPVRLRPAKPCSRCSMVDVDPASGRIDAGVLAALHAYRRDPRLDGAVTFGMNLMVLEGYERRLSVGQSVRARSAAS